MSPEQFCYWLQGFVELHGSPPTDEQWKSIVDHIKLVFDKRTPERRPAFTPPDTTVLPMPPQHYPNAPYPPYIGDPLMPFHTQVVC